MTNTTSTIAASAVLGLANNAVENAPTLTSALSELGNITSISLSPVLEATKNLTGIFKEVSRLTVRQHTVKYSVNSAKICLAAQLFGKIIFPLSY